MNQNAFNVIAACIFSTVSALHLLRIVFGWEASIAGWTVPGWASWAALVVAAGLAAAGFRLAFRRIS